MLVEINKSCFETVFPTISQWRNIEVTIKNILKIWNASRKLTSSIEKYLEIILDVSKSKVWCGYVERICCNFFARCSFFESILEFCNF